MPVKYMQMLKRPRIYRKNHEKGSETVNFDNQEKQARCRAQVAIWYENEGFERIQAIRKTLESENRNCFSVNREGICSIPLEKGISKDWNFKRLSFWTDRGDPGKTKEGWFHHQYGMQ